MPQSNIASAINAAHAGVEAAKKEGARYAIECGRLLHEAKATVPHGQWDAWVKQHCRFSARTAQLYMRVSTHIGGDPAKAQRVADLSLRDLDRVSRTNGVPRRRLSDEAEAQAEELMARWRESKPEWRVCFAQKVFVRGETNPDQFKQMVTAAVL